MTQEPLAPHLSLLTAAERVEMASRRGLRSAASTAPSAPLAQDDELAAVSLMPHLHARRQEPPPAHASLLPHLHAQPAEALPPEISLLAAAERVEMIATGRLSPPSTSPAQEPARSGPALRRPTDWNGVFRAWLQGPDPGRRELAERALRTFDTPKSRALLAEAGVTS